MKKITALLMLICLVCLTGCSNADPTADMIVKWEDGTTSINGTQVYFSEYYTGYAKVDSGMGGFDYELYLDYAKDATTTSVNTAGILEENMDKFKKKLYYTEYLGTQFTMLALVGDDTWAVCRTVCSRDTESTALAAYASDYIDNIPLTSAQVYVDFGSFVFGDEYSQVIVRPDCALIKSLVKVSKDPCSATDPYTIYQDEKEYQLMKKAGEKYDYYTYDGYTIQCVAGVTPDSYIKFK